MSLSVGVRVPQFGNSCPTPISNVPPWLFPKAKVDLNILQLKKNWVESKIGHCANQYVNNHFYNCLQIFTDGSKYQNDHVGAGVYIPQFKINIGKRIPDK